MHLKVIFAPTPCLPPDKNACASEKKTQTTVVSLTCLSWPQIMRLNRELFEKHDSKYVQSCLDVGKHMFYFIHAKKLPCYFLSPLYFSNAVFSVNGAHVLIVKVAFFQYSLKLITLSGSGALYLICEQLFMLLRQYKAMFHITSLPDYYTIVF